MDRVTVFGDVARDRLRQPRRSIQGLLRSRTTNDVASVQRRLTIPKSGAATVRIGHAFRRPVPDPSSYPAGLATRVRPTDDTAPTSLRRGRNRSEIGASAG